MKFLLINSNGWFITVSIYKFFRVCILAFASLMISSCSNAKVNTFNEITESNVSKCNYDHSYIDFCSKKNINQYNLKLNDKVNFSNNLILSILSSEVDFGKGSPKSLKYIVVIDPKLKQVFTLNQYVGNFVNDKLDEIKTEPPKITFKNNIVCLSGTTYSHFDNNVNVSNECYTFIKNKFVKIEKKSSQNQDSSFPITSLPYSSKKHIECIMDHKAKNCESMHLIPTEKLEKKFSFINVNQGDSVILPANKMGKFLIISPFEDEEVNLRIMTVKGNILLEEKIIPASQGLFLKQQ